MEASKEPDLVTMRTESQGADFDLVVVGAGFSGLYMLHRARQLGFRTRVFEAGDEVGGTWYWNRYPGARCDSESVYYMLSDRASEDILQEWTWSERFAGQPEIWAYLKFVADKLDLRRDIQFNTRISAAHWDEQSQLWRLTTAVGEQVSARFFISAVGCLSTANIPEIPGLESFQGRWLHTGQWPHEPVSFAGRRVAVIGTGATGVQVVPEVAKEAAQVYVFQRTPNFDIPGHNHPLEASEIEEIKRNYRNLWERTRQTGFGMPFEAAERSTFSVSPEERQQIYEGAWTQGGFHVGLDTFNDLLFDQEANDSIAEFVRTKIRETVKRPEVAEWLAPKDHAFFTKRPPLEHGYYQAFNRDNVALINLRQTPIEKITAQGIQTRDQEFQVDDIIFATGFDAMTGTLFRIDIRGRAGLALKEAWQDGPKTYMGLAAHGFPNMFMITGPQSPSVLTNMPVAIEQHVDWIADCLVYLREHGLAYIEADEEAQERWVAIAAQIAELTLLSKTDSWWRGANIPGKPRLLYPYVGGLNNYRVACDEVAAKGYEGFALRASAAPASSLQT